MRTRIFFWAWLILVSSCCAEIITADDEGPADLHVPTPNYPTIQAAINAGRVSVRDTDINNSLRIDGNETG
ncbi:MAG: hypothetical protein ACYSWR_03535 [Planctomycetota bacterium]|jgi:hypothetical protein